MTKAETEMINEKLIAFARWAIIEHRESCLDLEAVDIEEKLIELGLLIELLVEKPCGDNCRCVEYHGEFPCTCLRLETGVLIKEQRQVIDEQVEENRGLRRDVLLMQEANAEQRAVIDTLDALVNTKEERCVKYQAEIDRLTHELSQANEACTALRDGKPLGPVIGAQTILNQSKEIDRLTKEYDTWYTIANDLLDGNEEFRRVAGKWDTSDTFGIDSHAEILARVLTENAQLRAELEEYRSIAERAGATVAVSALTLARQEIEQLRAQLATAKGEA
jgi:hypothetical protein